MYLLSAKKSKAAITSTTLAINLIYCNHDTFYILGNVNKNIITYNDMKNGISY